MSGSAPVRFDNILFNLWINAVYDELGQEDIMIFICGPASARFGYNNW